MAGLNSAYVGPGEVLDLPAPYDRTAGQGALIGDTFGVAANTVLSGATGQFHTEGEWNLAKTAGQTFAAGALVYWDNTAKSVTAVSAGNRRIGSATLAAAGGDTTARVRLSGAPAPAGA